MGIWVVSKLRISRMMYGYVSWCGYPCISSKCIPQSVMGGHKIWVLIIFKYFYNFLSSVSIIL